MRLTLLSLLIAVVLLPDHLYEPPLCATFSIVCRDPVNGDFAVGVTTMPKGVRRLCPFARAGVGAVSTQARVNVSLGPRGLELMGKGLTPTQALNQALKEDNGRANRQLAMIDGKNTPAAYTGSGCMSWAGHVPRKDFSTQGNILVSRKTLDEVVRVFESTPGSLAGRILAALKAGKTAGGDKRGHNSCAVIVASKRADGDQLLIDLKEDDDPDPVARVYEKFLKQCAAWLQVGDRELREGDAGPDVKELEAGLVKLGYLEGEPDETFDEGTAKALTAFQKKKRLPRTGRVDLKTAQTFVKETSKRSSRKRNR